VRKLIVNADDFGLTAGVNRAILETHTAGVVSSTTLMANGPQFDDAVALARSTPSLSVGCHVVLVDGTPVSPSHTVDTLRAIRSAEPQQFYSSLSAFAARATLGGFDRDQLVAEVVAQIKTIQSTGLQVTHLDTHKHAHIFPEILNALLRAARTCHQALGTTAEFEAYLAGFRADQKRKPNLMRMLDRSGLTARVPGLPG